MIWLLAMLALGAPTDAPPATDSVRTLLMARHTSDLPDREALAQRDGAMEALVWLAENDDRLIVRERALMLLGDYPEPEAQAACTAALAMGHGKLRAAGVRCLGDRDDDAVLKLVGDDDPRVGNALVDILWPRRADALQKAEAEGALSQAALLRLAEKR